MGDSGEGLVDANSRIEERMEEMQDRRRMTNPEGSGPDPEKMRLRESLRLARIDLERQLSTSSHETRRKHLLAALAEIDRRLKDLQSAV
jgi:hypothetical protein